MDVYGDEEWTAIKALAKAEGVRVFLPKRVGPARLWSWEWNGVRANNWYVSRHAATIDFLKWRGIISDV